MALINDSVTIAGPPLRDGSVRAGEKTVRFKYTDNGAIKVGMTSVTLDGSETAESALTKAVAAANAALA